MSSGSVRHPVGLSVLCVVVGYERFAGALIGSLLVLYLNERLGLDAAASARLSGYAVALGYAAAIGGGVLADRVLGQRRAMLLGLLGMLGAFGLLALASSRVVLAAIVLLSVGSGLFKPAITALVGMLYPVADVRRSEAYGWLYFAINVGGLLGPFVGGLARARYGWPSVFVACLCAVALGLLAAVLGWPASTPLQSTPIPTEIEEKSPRAPRLGPLAVVLLALGALGLSFAQISGTLLLWARDFSRRELWGWTLPPELFAALPSAVVLAFSPVLSALWRTLGARGREPSEPSKLALGLGLVALAFALCSTAGLVTGEGRANALWLVAAKMLITLGEMVAFPVGLALASSLASARRSASVMGLSFGSMALGYSLGGEAGRLWGLLSPPWFFAALALGTLGTAALVAALAQRLRR